MFMQKRIVSIVLPLIAAGAVILTQTAASKTSARAYQLGGAWEGQLEGISWMGIHAPLDPNGKRAAIKWQWMSTNPEMAGIVQNSGGTSLSDVVGDIVMKTPDTAEYKQVFWVIGPGSNGLPERKLKVVMTGTWHYLDANTAETVDLAEFYLPDGTFAGSKEYAAHPHYRVSVD